jgi:hypothetical protein
MLSTQQPTTRNAQLDVRRPRIRSLPRPPEQRSREPVGLTSDDLLAGFYALTLAVVTQAHLDVGHKCWRGGCKGRNDCERRRDTARRFLIEIHEGRAELWSDWLHLAASRARPARFR